MKYYKEVTDNIIIGLYKSDNLSLTEITEEEYNTILLVVQNKPEDTDTIIYKLHADTLEYVAYDKPAVPVIEPTDPVIDSIIREVANSGY